MIASLPNEWSVVRADLFCTDVADGTHATPKPVEGGRLLLTSKNIKQGRIVRDNAYGISQKDFDEINRRSKVSKWDVLFSMIGTVGEIALVTYRPDFAIKNVGLFRSRSKYEGAWLYYYLISPSGKASIDSSLSGSSQQFVSLGDLRKLPIIKPPQKVMEKITAILSAYDDLIENNTRRIALLEKMAEEVYREWFVRLRFPGHEKVQIHQGLPEDWTTLPTEDAFQFTGGGTPSKEESRYWTDGTINWFTPSDITGADGIFLTSSGMKCNEEGFRQSSARMFPPNSLMMTSRATIGAIGVNTTPACTNQGFITCIPNDEYPLPYIYFWLKLNKEYFESISTGSTFLELTKSKFRAVQILKPPREIMELYLEASYPVFNLIQNLQGESVNLRATRDALLSRLLSGTLEVENLDIHFPPGMTAGE